MIGKRFQNVSGKTIQVPNRISGAFSWSPGERIDILDECKLLHTEGYLVHNIDYVGNFRAHETAWITKEILEQSFKEVIELCSCYYPVNTYMHTGSKICGNCKKLIPCYK
jgi:hypothetical protein